MSAGGADSKAEDAEGRLGVLQAATEAASAATASASTSGAADQV